MIKRTLDFSVALCGLVVLSPLLALVAVLVWLDSGRPILFTQIRVGRGFRPFRILKFRTMVNGASSIGGAVTAASDSRTTRAGRWLRKTKLDELPQLWNVVRGDMSLVGPRPEVLQYVELFRNEYERILRVRPGITDYASMVYRNEEAILGRAPDPDAEYRHRILPHKLQLSTAYLEHSTIASDVALMVRTVVGLGPKPLPQAMPGLSTNGPQPSNGPVGKPTRPQGHLKRIAIRRLVTWRRPVVVVLHLILIVLSSYLAFWLRFDGEIPPEELSRLTRTLPWLVAIRGLAFIPFRLYEGLWRYTGIWDLSRIVAAVVTSTVTFYVWLYLRSAVTNYPRSIFIIDSVLLIMMMGGIRLARRVRHEIFLPRASRRVLIVGAGDAGEMLVRDMLKRGKLGYTPVGFIDDDPHKRGQRIHGVKVIGDRSMLPSAIEALKPSEVVVASPEMTPGMMRELVTVLEPFKLRISTLPQLSDIVDGTVTVSSVRDLSIEDLLSRAPVDLDPRRLEDLIGGRSVLVTGAGGSIGSELCRQVARLQPRVLVMYERHENGLYTIASELEDAGLGPVVRPMIGDVTDLARLEQTFAEYRPDIVFHAAAHKHVPLMEAHVGEAVKNNVLGTRLVAEVAIRHGVERFILVSTDKAVEPSSVMGATKRAAELTIQTMTPPPGTRLSAVRFGNVLGSNGSVVPRFLSQIRSGGPVTVTHPEMRRYFMLIPEAVQLLLHAAALTAHGQNIYVLDMGDQCSLNDLARKLIRLSGFVPGEEISVTYVGLRPGEKLAERLVAEDELVEPTVQDKILAVTPLFAPNATELLPRLRELEARALEGDTAAVWCLLRQVVPFASPPLVEPAAEPEVVAAREGSPESGSASLNLNRDHDNRRLGPPDRRNNPRGGRRLADRVRLAAARPDRQSRLSAGVLGRPAASAAGAAAAPPALTPVRT